MLSLALFFVVFGIIFMFIPNRYFIEQGKFLKKTTPKWWYNIYEKNDLKEQAKNYNSKIIAGVIMILFGLVSMVLIYFSNFGK